MSFDPRERELEHTFRHGQPKPVEGSKWKWVDSYRTIGLAAGAVIGVITGYLTARYYFAGSGTGAVLGIIIGFFSGGITGRLLGYLATRLNRRRR